jgi:hypothetical protein
LPPDAFEADILMISSRGGLGLAAGAKAWIESWLAQGTRAIALVALFGCEVHETQTVRAYLADVARRGCLEFFAQPDQWPENENSMDEFVTGGSKRGMEMPCRELCSTQAEPAAQG